MSRRHLRTVAISYAVVTFLTGLGVLGWGDELFGFVVLSTSVGCMLLFVAKSHFNWKAARQHRRQTREAKRRRAVSPQQPKRFRDRLAHFTNRDRSDDDRDAESLQSHMPFWSKIDVRHTTPVRPKSAAFIRRTLMLIRSIVRMSR